MERVVYAVVVESSLLKGVGARLTPELRGKLRQIGIDLDQKLLPTYPLTVYREAVSFVARELFPTLAPAAGIRELGVFAARHYEHTMVGKMMIGAIRLLGPHRMLEKASTQFRAVTNFLECKTTKLGPTRYEMWLSSVGERAPYYEGLVTTMLGFTGAKDVKMRTTARDGEAVTFEITWS